MKILLSSALTILSVIVSACTSSNMTKEEVFWSWFQSNEARLFELENGQQQIFGELSDAMKRVHPDLTFELGPNRNGVREFVISAGGIKEAFPAVNGLADKAPQMPRWQIVRFRQRRELSPHINFEGTEVRNDQFRFTLEPDGMKAGITLYIDGYQKATHHTLGNVGFLFLDNCLGEYDVETKVGFIEFKPANEPTTLEKKPLADLPAAFDKFLSERRKVI